MYECLKLREYFEIREGIILGMCAHVASLFIILCSWHQPEIIQALCVKARCRLLTPLPDATTPTACLPQRTPLPEENYGRQTIRNLQRGWLYPPELD